MSSSARALRRHHAARIKHNRSKHQAVQGVGRTTRADDRRLGKHAQTAAACSCFMCGNPRKYFGEPTIQERRFNQVELLKDEWDAGE